MCRRLANTFTAASQLETVVVRSAESSLLSADQKMSQAFALNTGTAPAGIVFKLLSGWF